MQARIAHLRERAWIDTHRPGGRLAPGHVWTNQLENVAARLAAKGGHRAVVHGAGVGHDGLWRIRCRREIEDGARRVEPVGGDRRRPRQAPRGPVAPERLGGDEVDAPADVEGEVTAQERPRLVDGDAQRLVVAAGRVREKQATVLGGDGDVGLQGGRRVDVHHVDGLERPAHHVPADRVRDLRDAAGVDAHDDVVTGLMGLLPGPGTTRGEQGDGGDRYGEGSSDDHVG
jgi:hypothetical protein